MLHSLWLQTMLHSVWLQQQHADLLKHSHVVMTLVSMKFINKSMCLDIVNWVWNVTNYTFGTELQSH